MLSIYLWIPHYNHIAELLILKSISDSSADGVRGGVQLVRPPVNHRDDSFTFTKTCNLESLDCTNKLQHQNKTHADTAATTAPLYVYKNTFFYLEKTPRVFSCWVLLYVFEIKQKNKRCV